MLLFHLMKCYSDYLTRGFHSRGRLLYCNKCAIADIIKVMTNKLLLSALLSFNICFNSLSWLKKTQHFGEELI